MKEQEKIWKQVNHYTYKAVKSIDLLYLEIIWNFFFFLCVVIFLPRETGEQQPPK